MARPAEQASRVSTQHVQVFVPSVDRDGNPIPLGQEHWVKSCLAVMGEHFGGATALPPALGVWRDDENDGQLIYDETVVVFSYVAEGDLTETAEEELMN